MDIHRQDSLARYILCWYTCIRYPWTSGKDGEVVEYLGRRKRRMGKGKGMRARLNERAGRRAGRERERVCVCVSDSTVQ